MSFTLDDAADWAARQAEHDANESGTAQTNDPIIQASLWYQMQGKSGPDKKPKKQKDEQTGIPTYAPQATATPHDSTSELDPDPTMAEDGQGLDSQSLSTQTDFQNKYGTRAKQEWVKEHNNELAQNRMRYGVSEPPAWMKKSNIIDMSNGVLPAATSVTTTTPAVPAYTPTTSPTTLTTAPVQSGTKVPQSATTSAVQTRAPSDDDMITIQNTSLNPPMDPITIRRGQYQATPDQQSTVQNSRTYTAASGWKVISDPTQQQAPATAPAEKDTGLATSGAAPQKDVGVATGSTTTDPTQYKSMSTQMVNPAVDINEKPIDTLATLSVKRQGGRVGNVAQESDRILNGIGALIRGDKNGAWAEAYLNDVARIAWARQQRDSGTVADPREAPQDYIEKWKDAFYGSDPSVPLVKELDQQMIDHAVSRTPDGGTQFDWRKAYGPNGEAGLISKQVASNDCGPNAFSTMLRSRGYNLDPESAFAYAKEHGYHDGEEFTGPYNYARMLRQEAGLDAQAVPLQWKQVDTELDAGRPVTLSGPGHYWVASAYRDTEQGREYYVGATGAVVGNPQWARADQIQYQGQPNILITARGDVDPNSRSVKELGLRPAGSTSTPDRANLTRENQTVSAAPNTSGAIAYAPMIAKAGKQNNVDPLLIESVLDAESQEVSGAKSSQGAIGLMQLMPDTARGLGVQDPTDPEQSIQGGSKYLRQLLDMFDGDLDLALAAYNAGPAAVIKYGGIPPYVETQNYVKTVKAHYQQIARQNQ